MSEDRQSRPYAIVVVVLLLLLLAGGVVWYVRSTADRDQPIEPHGNAEQVTDRQVGDETPTEETTPVDVHLEFLPAALEIERDYDQRGMVKLKNTENQAIAVRVRAKPPADLPAGFVGRGTDDWYEFTSIDIGPGEAMAFPFIAHGHHARGSSYEVPVEALVKRTDWEVAATGTVAIKIKPVELDVIAEWIEPTDELQRARLAKILRVTNDGAVIPDLTIDTGSLAGRVYTHPTVENMRLGSGESVDVVVEPVLSPSFESVHGALEIRGHGQAIETEFSAEVPDGKSLFVTLSRSTSVVSNTGARCTNEKNVAYGFPPTSGTPGASGGEAADNEDDSEWGFTGFDVGTSPEAGGETQDTPESDDGLRRSAENAISLTDGATGTLPPEATGSDVIPGEEMDDLLAGVDEEVEGWRKAWEKYWSKDMTFDEFMEMVRDAESTGMILHPPGTRPGPRDAFDEIPNIPRDFISNTGETAVLTDEAGKKAVATVRRKKNSRNTGMQFHDFGFGIAGPGRRVGSGGGGGGGGGGAARSLPVTDGSFPARQPILGQTTEGRVLAGYTRPAEQGGSVVEIKDVESGKVTRIGDGVTRTSSPQIVPGDDGTDVVVLDDGKVKSLRLDSNLNGSTPQTIYSRTEAEPIDELLRAKRDPNGTVSVLTRDDEMLSLTTGDQTRRITGSSGDFAYVGGEPVVIATNPNGSIDSVAPDGSRTQVLPAGSPSPTRPSLLNRGDDGLRMVYHVPLVPRPAESSGGAESERPVRRMGGTFTADFSAGQWSQPRRAVQPEQPVTRAAIALDVQPKYSNGIHKPLDTTVRVNGYKVGELNGRSPSGRYLFQVPPAALSFRSPFGSLRAAGNQVTLDVEGTGPGNMTLTENANLYTRHSLMQEVVVADSQDHADRLVARSDATRRHGAPDLVLTNNLWELPRDVPSGQTVEATIGLFNTGDKTVPAGDLIVRHQDAEIGRASYAEVPPYTPQEVAFELVMPSRNDDESVEMIVEAAVEGDAQPENNRLVIRSLPNYSPYFDGPRLPVAIDISRLTEDEVQEIDPRKQPFETPLTAASMWYKLPVSISGTLQVELIDTPDDAVLGIDLFSETGEMLTPDSELWKTAEANVLVRLGLKPDYLLPQAATLRIYWEDE